ncbi:MAG: MGMT family protein [Minisyncoccia bacterium]
MTETFKKKVLEVVSNIKKGDTLTYKKVAELAGKSRAYRAVGNILNSNHSTKIPCHRVIRSDGKPGGYNRGTAKKQVILKREGAI